MREDKRKKESLRGEERNNNGDADKKQALSQTRTHVYEQKCKLTLAHMNTHAG